MRFLICTFLAFLPFTVHAQDTSLSTGKEYDDGKGGTVWLPLGEASFADVAVSYVPGARSASGIHARPDQALGAPDYTSPSSPGFIALGCDGTAVLQFTDNVLFDVEGVDLHIFEVGPRVEPAELAISPDGVEWTEVGRIAGAHSDVDIAPFVEAGDVFYYVRLTNVGTDCSGRTPGADIDAVAAVGSGYRISLSGAVLFDVNEAVLKQEAEQKLANIAEQIREVGGPIRLVIEGHTDSTGSPDNNEQLSAARAASVWTALSSLVELTDDRVTTRGRGETRPVAGNDTEEGRAQNRRVDILILPQRE